MRAIIISIGDELVLGQTLDTNSHYISGMLAERGIMTHAHHATADDRQAIGQALSWAAQMAELVIVTGGIGPTEDDLTRFALADVLGEELIEDAQAVEAIKAFFSRRNRPMPERNRLQALRPPSATFIANPNGTAPGLSVKIGEANCFITPGVPSEMKAMFRDHIQPRIDALHAASGSVQVIRTKKINTFGLGESTVAEQLGDLMDRERNPLVGTTVADSIVSIRIRSAFETAEQTDKALQETSSLVENKLGPYVFGHDNDTLQQAVVQLLTDCGNSVATAESCTGGLLGSLLTSVSGSAAVYRGGWVTYTNQMKVSQLDVDADLIARQGAVDEMVARAMAQGARRKAESDFAISITGIAGPTGGSEHKPVGTVWVGLATREQTHAMLLQLSGDREQIRDRSAKAALQMLRFLLLDIPLNNISFGQVMPNT